MGMKTDSFQCSKQILFLKMEIGYCNVSRCLYLYVCFRRKFTNKIAKSDQVQLSRQISPHKYLPCQCTNQSKSRESCRNKMPKQLNNIISLFCFLYILYLSIPIKIQQIWHGTLGSSKPVLKFPITRAKFNFILLCCVYSVYCLLLLILYLNKQTTRKQLSDLFFGLLVKGVVLIQNFRQFTA